MKFSLKKVNLSKIEVTPEKLWTSFVALALVVFLLGILHAGFIFWKYGSGKDVLDPTVQGQNIKLDVEALNRVTGSTREAGTSTIPIISNPFE